MSNRSRGDGDQRSTPPNIDVMHSLKVDNLTYRTRVEDLRRVFEKYGPIGDIYIPRDQFSRSSRGYAFIRFVFFAVHFYLKYYFIVLQKNATLKMHLIVWMVPMLMDVKYAFNLLVMVVHQQPIVAIKHVVDGTKKHKYFFSFEFPIKPVPQTKLIISIHTGDAVSGILFENKIR
jgi:hypothetical protein